MTEIKKTNTEVKIHTKMQPLFTKTNTVWMMIGGVVMLLGFFLMSGGKSADPNVFDPKVVYSTTRITIAPMFIIAGFLIEIYAIFKKAKAN